MTHVCVGEWNILTFIQKYKADNRIMPTIGEIAEGVGIRRSKVYRLMCEMEAAGLLILCGAGERRGRTIVLIPQPVGLIP